MAPNRRWFEAWCHENERSPRDRRLIPATSAADARRLEGCTPDHADLVVAGWPENGSDFAALHRTLRRGGFTVP